MVSMPPELGETSHELSELSSLVKKIETAQLESRPLSSDEATALDVAFSKTNLRELCQAKLADSAKSELCSLAHRIWAAVGQGPPYDPLQDAKCRNLACNIFSASFRGCIPPSDALLLSAHWAFSGQAWMRADASSPLALPCFAEAAKAWRSQPSVKLAQVAAQALLWAGEAHFRQVSYIEAFSQLSQARDIICSYQDWDGMLDNFLRVCFEQANAHRAAGNLSEAIELLNLAIAAGPNAAPAAKCRLLRALALCHVSGVEGMAHAKQAFALSPTSKDRVLSLQVLLELLLGKESALETSKIQEAQVAALSLAKEQPLGADDECIASDTCALNALQRTGKRKTMPVPAEQSHSLLQDASRSAGGGSILSSWQGVRETGSSCMWTNCDEVSLGPTTCHHWRCICKEGYYYNKEASKCTAQPKDVGDLDTGGQCRWTNCHPSRGLTRCVSYKCLCLAGYRAAEGKCVPKEGMRQTPETGIACGSPSINDLCWKAVDWAMYDGIYADPKEYPGLHPGMSSFDEFQSFINKIDPVTCPKPCGMVYETFASPRLLDPSYHAVKGVSYGPAPVKKPGSPLMNDDFMADITGAMWADWGRGDLQLIKDMGGNTIRMYGNDANTSHRAFLDLAYKKGIDVIAGMSDFGFTQGPDNCLINDWYCYDEAYFFYHKNLLMGFAIDDFKRYHPALKALILANEPDLKVHPRSLTCRAMASVFDAILQAEKDVGVTGNPIALTITWSFAMFPDSQVHPNAPALGQMEEFWKCLQDGPEKPPINYKPKNNLVQAFRTRFVHSFNTANKANEVAHMMLEKYIHSSFWTHEMKVPVFIGEYHSVHGDMMNDLTSAIKLAKSPRYPFFMGYSFFEFSRSYWKGGPEMEFGMYGYGDCPLMDMNYTGLTYTIWNLIPMRDRRGHSLPSALKKAFTQDSGLPKLLSHPHIECKASTKGLP